VIAVSELPTDEINRPVARFLPGHAYECRVVVTNTPAGVSAQSADFPDVVCEASNVEEALEELASRLRTKLSRYAQSGRIPWPKPAPKSQPGEMRLLITIADTVASSADLSEQPFDVSERDADFVRELRARGTARPKMPLDDPNLAIEE
jgi:hypothetical protein